MADNVIVSNTPLGVFEVRTTKKSSKDVQHFLLDLDPSSGSEKILSDANPLPTKTITYTFRFDDDSTANIIYLGKAVAGSLITDPVWQISRLQETTGNKGVLFANGSTAFNQIWANRLAIGSWS